MPAITEGVEFTNVAREWRMKWSEDGDKKSLAAVQKVLDAKIAAIKAVAGACVFVDFRGDAPHALSLHSLHTLGYCSPLSRSLSPSLTCSARCDRRTLVAVCVAPAD